MKTLEVVALIDDIPEKHLRRGQVGTVVELLAPSVVEVEFADLDGNPYAAIGSKRRLRARTGYSWNTQYSGHQQFTTSNFKLNHCSQLVFIASSCHTFLM